VLASFPRHIEPPCTQLPRHGDPMRAHLHQFVEVRRLHDLAAAPVPVGSLTLTLLGCWVLCFNCVNGFVYQVRAGGWLRGCSGCGRGRAPRGRRAPTGGEWSVASFRAANVVVGWDLLTYAPRVLVTKYFGRPTLWAGVYLPTRRACLSRNVEGATALGRCHVDDDNYVMLS
jgi:hypothetical protein